MKRFYAAALLVFLLLLSFFMHAQQVTPNLVLTGSISNYDNKKYFYYSNDLHSKLDTTQKVYVKNDYTYTFDLSKTPFRNKLVDKLFFAWELDKDGKIANGCYSSINIAAIREHCIKNNLKSIDLKNDFNLTFNCESTVAEEFVDEKKKLGGTYKMVVNDTTYILELSTYMLSTLSGDYNPRDKNYCNKIWGWWGYKEDGKQLGLYTHYYINKDWGIYINANNPLYFTVTKNESAKLIFKNTNGNVVLEKL